MLPSVAVSCPLRQSCHVAQAGIKLKILPHPPWCWNCGSNAPDSADSPQYPLPLLQSNHVQTPRHQRSSIYVQRNKDQAFWESQASLFPTDTREHFSNSMGSRNCSHGVKACRCGDGPGTQQMATRWLLNNLTGMGAVKPRAHEAA